MQMILAHSNWKKLGLWISYNREIVLLIVLVAKFICKREVLCTCFGQLNQLISLAELVSFVGQYVLELAGCILGAWQSLKVHQYIHQCMKSVIVLQVKGGKNMAENDTSKVIQEI